MKKLKDILSEFALKSFPDWNQIQVSVFRELSKDSKLSNEDISRIAKKLRDHMNSRYFSGVWNVDKSKEDLFDELLQISKNTLRTK
jgi:hypothetical protein